MAQNVSVDVLVTAADRHSALCADVLRGLTTSPKSLPPIWFYDETGSRLFDRITRLPEYYLTRAEREILDANVAQIAELANAETLVEIGSGTSEKTLLLLDAMSSAGSLRRIVLLDISEEVLREAAASLSDRYDVEVHAVVGDFRVDLPKVPRGESRQLWAFLGSTIGNFTPPERRQLLSEFRASMGPDDHLLLGTDLIKDPARLVAAYDDAEGVTAAFNRNVLAVLNAELDADFVPDAFEHHAEWNAEERWIEMRLRSRDATVAHVRELDLQVAFERGEDILTEISSKFDPARIAQELAAAGLDAVHSWTDAAGDFGLTIARTER